MVLVGASSKIGRYKEDGFKTVEIPLDNRVRPKMWSLLEIGGLCEIEDGDNGGTLLFSGSTTLNDCMCVTIQAAISSMIPTIKDMVMDTDATGNSVEILCNIQNVPNIDYCLIPVVLYNTRHEVISVHEFMICRSSLVNNFSNCITVSIDDTQFSK